MYSSRRMDERLGEEWGYVGIWWRDYGRESSREVHVEAEGEEIGKDGAGALQDTILVVHIIILPICIFWPARDCPDRLRNDRKIH